MERDDITEYAHQDHHSEEEGKKIRKKIWFVFWVLLAVTTIEVLVGAFRTTLGLPWTLVKWSFIIMTLIKAFYIVMSFMHLGEELKNFRRFILVPYGIFIVYLIIIALYEGITKNEAAMEEEKGEKAKKEALIRQQKMEDKGFQAFRRA